MVDDRGVAHPGSPTGSAVLLILVCLLAVNTAEGGNITTLQAYQECLASPVTCTKFDVSNSGLTGTIPSEIGMMTAHTSLLLNFNQLSGSIPSQTGAMTSLEQMTLGNNILTGTIPSELAAITALKKLFLGNNQLTGSIPSELGAMTSMEDLDLNSNRLTGTIPSELGAMTFLKHLDLGFNQLTGTVPSELTAMTALVFIGVNTNRLTGISVPSAEVPSAAPKPTRSSMTTTSPTALPTASLAAFGTLGGVFVCVIFAAIGSLRSDANGRPYHRRWLPCHQRWRVYLSDISLYQDMWEKSLRAKKGLPVVGELLNILSKSQGRKKGALQGFRESRDVFLHNLDECHAPLPTSSSAIPISDFPSSYDASLSHDEPSKIQIMRSLSTPTTLDIDQSLSLPKGHVKESQGIIQGNNSTYYIIKSLQGGCQSACFLVSMERDGGGSFYVAKVYSSFEISTQAVTEAYILGQAKHANILEIVECFADQDCLIIITRFCEFGDIGTLVQVSQKNGVAMEEPWIMEVFVQICLALRHLHKTCIIHRDLKPANIFMDRYGTVKIGDFGLSKMTTTHLASTIVGTPYYMAPEINQGNAYSFSSDMWSLGITIYFLCTNTKPFDAMTVFELEQKKNAGNFQPMEGYSDGLNALVREMLHLDPTKRPTAADVLESPFVGETVMNLRKQIKDGRQ